MASVCLDFYNIPCTQNDDITVRLLTTNRLINSQSGEDRAEAVTH